MAYDLGQVKPWAGTEVGLELSVTKSKNKIMI